MKIHLIEAALSSDAHVRQRCWNTAHQIALDVQSRDSYLGLVVLSEVLICSDNEDEQEQGEIHFDEILKDYPFNSIGYIVYYLR